MKKVIIAMFALVFVVGIVACGSDVDKAAKDTVAVMKAYVDGAKGVIDLYAAAKTADDVKKADEASQKLATDMGTKMGELQKKYEKVDTTKLQANASVSNAQADLMKASQDLAAAQQKAIEATKDAKKDEKKK